MTFNADTTKEAQKIIFSCKISKSNHPGLMCNNNIVNLAVIHRHLGMLFNSNLSLTNS